MTAYSCCAHYTILIIRMVKSNGVTIFMLKWFERIETIADFSDWSVYFAIRYVKSIAIIICYKTTVIEHNNYTTLRYVRGRLRIDKLIRCTSQNTPSYSWEK